MTSLLIRESSSPLLFRAIRANIFNGNEEAVENVANFVNIILKHVGQKISYGTVDYKYIKNNLGEVFNKKVKLSESVTLTFRNVVKMPSQTSFRYAVFLKDWFANGCQMDLRQLSKGEKIQEVVKSDIQQCKITSLESFMVLASKTWSERYIIRRGGQVRLNSDVLREIPFSVHRGNINITATLLCSSLKLPTNQVLNWIVGAKTQGYDVAKLTMNQYLLLKLLCDTGISKSRVSEFLKPQSKWMLTEMKFIKAWREKYGCLPQTFKNTDGNLPGLPVFKWVSQIPESQLTGMIKIVRHMAELADTCNRVELFGSDVERVRR
ncbi:hypothetical protein DP148_26795, partial [Salmonella enterica subsp. enterica serovar Typhimurium]